MKIYDRAGFGYEVTENPTTEKSYVSFTTEGKPVVVREGKEVKSSFFTDGEGRWARLTDSSNETKLAKALKSKEIPVIAYKDGKIICQLVPLIGIIWHDSKGNKFFLVSRYEREEMESDNLPYITAESEGTYETLRYIAYNGTEEVEVPRILYNEKNRRFTVGVNYKAMAYDKMRKDGTASVAIKNALKPVYARKAETDEFIMAHTNGAYEANEVANEGEWIVEYVSGGGSWAVKPEEFVKRYEFYSVDEKGRAIFIAKENRSVWVHLFGDFLGCMPQWGDSMVAMSNPQVNITNPDDVYACSYIEFYGKEDMDGSYIVVDTIYLGAPKYAVEEFYRTLAGYIETAFGVPKSRINSSTLSDYLQMTMGIPVSLTVLQARVAEAAAA